MQYRTLADLSNLVRTNMHKIPHDIDLVVGIPRSGMLPANMIALFLNKRLTDLESFIEGRIMSAGDRSKFIHDSSVKNVLIVDDSVCTGGSLSKAKEKLLPFYDQYDLVFAAPIVTTLGKQFVDIYFEVIDTPRVFEWNLFHHSCLSNACMDIDGVLNVDPVNDDDGPIYESFLKTATPLFIPTAPIRTLISCRLEKYRLLTERWLQSYGIQYEELVMLDMPDKNSRVKWNKHGEYKGIFFATHDHSLFIESSLSQAQKISNMSRKPVICIESNSIVYPSDSTISKKKVLKRVIKSHFPRLYNIFLIIVNR